MDKKLFYGTCTALVTPFCSEGIDYPVLDKLLDRQIHAGISSILVAGTTGEGSTLSDDEKIELIKHCKEHVSDRCLIIAGTGSNCTHHAIELSVRAQSNGADALLVVSPYYNKANNEGLIAHYSIIAQAVDIPIIVYNVPSRTGVDIPVCVYHALSKIPNIAGVKEASQDIRKIQEIRSKCHKSFGVWSGNDDMICASMATGADGVISVVSNILPAETKALTDAALIGDYFKAAKLQSAMLPLIDCLFCEVNPIPVKYALQVLGMIKSSYRLPLTEPSDVHQKQIYDCLTAFKTYDPSVLYNKM